MCGLERKVRNGSKEEDLRKLMDGSKERRHGIWAGSEKGICGRG